MRVLGAVTVLVFAVGPSVNAAARAAFAPERVYSPALVDQVLQWFVLSTHYRVVSLLPFVLAGVVLARLRLTALVQRTTAPMTPYESWPLYAGGVLTVTVLACWAWWQLLGKGPLERAMGLVTDRIG